MKRIILIAGLISLYINVFAVPNNISNKFNKIIKELDSIIVNSNIKNETVENHYKFIMTKIKNNDISVHYDANLGNSLRGCASSGIDSKDSLKYSLSFGKFLLDTYDVYPNLVRAIIMHEIQHLYDFCNNRNLIEISIQNCIEHTYFEIDALYLETLYLKNYGNNPDKQSKFEKFLLMDLNGGLQSSSILFEKTDLALLHQIDAIENEKDSFENGQNEFIRIGSELLSLTKFDNNEWNNYCNMIKLRTFIYYSKQVLHDLLFKLDNRSLKDNNLDFSRYPDFYKILTKVQAMIDKNNQYFKVSDEIINNFDNEIKSKIK